MNHKTSYYLHNQLPSMASTEDNNFTLRSFGRSKAQMSVGKILDTISAATPPQDGGKSVEKRPLLNIDLNLAPPEDGGGYESPDGGNREEIRATEAAGIEAHWSKGEKGMKSKNIVGDSEEKDRKIRVWNTLLEVAKTALLEHQQNPPIKAHQFHNPKRKLSHELELGAELTRRRITGNRRRSWNDETDAAEAVVVRSTRRRAVAMPNKYRDSLLDAAAMAEAELPRHNKSGVRKSR